MQPKVDNKQQSNDDLAKQMILQSENTFLQSLLRSGIFD